MPPVRCPDCRGLAYRHGTANRVSRCGLTRAEAFAKARWRRGGWVMRAFGQRGVGGARLVWRDVQHATDPDVRAMGPRAWLGPWRPVGPSWTAYLYADRGPDPAGSGPPPPPAGGGADEKNAPPLTTGG